MQLQYIWLSTGNYVNVYTVHAYPYVHQRAEHLGTA